MRDPINFVDWKKLKGKEARGVTKGVDLGEVQEIGKNYVVTKKGLVETKDFYIPKYLAQRYDGNTLWFNVTEIQLNEFGRDEPPTYEEYVRYRVEGVPSDIETRLRIAEA
jgi:hypothetical protein